LPARWRPERGVGEKNYDPGVFFQKSCSLRLGFARENMSFAAQHGRREKKTAEN